MSIFDGKVYLVAVVAIDAPEDMTLEELNAGGYIGLPCEVSRTEISGWSALTYADLRDCAIHATHKLNERVNQGH